MSHLLGVTQAAERLGLSVARTRRLIDDGRIKAVKVGSFWTVSEREIERFAAEPRPSGRRRSTPVLRFKAQHITPILKRTKTQTIRAKLPSTIVVGCTVNAACHYDQPPFASLTVTAIDTFDIDDIDDASAQRDGFNSADDLRRAVATTYPKAEHLIAVQFVLNKRITERSQ